MAWDSSRVGRLGVSQSTRLVTGWMGAYGIRLFDGFSATYHESAACTDLSAWCMSKGNQITGIAGDSQGLLKCETT